MFVEPSRAETEREEEAVSAVITKRVGIGIEELADLFLLDGIKGFGPQKFRQLWEAEVRVREVLVHPERLPIGGKTGSRLRSEIEQLDERRTELARGRAVRQILRAHENGARILTYDSPAYPGSVLESNNPISVLYVRGSLEVLARRAAIACVGSRQIGPPYEQRHRALAGFAAREGWVIVSGFATGADRVGHEAALEGGGATILVMPCGLDRPFPPENRDLWERLLRYDGAAMVSEFPFGTPAAALTLRKRNKLIVSFARGVLVSQSSMKGGAMNAYRFALEQKKPVATFEPMGTPETGGNRQIADGTTREARTSERDASLRRPPDQAGLRDRGTVFEAHHDDPGSWSRWLQEL